jgi:hypothetical protein
MTTEIKIPVTVFTMATDECEGVNLDGEDPADLRVFAALISDNPTAIALRIFPSKPRGYVSVTESLGIYAAMKARAMELRIAGRIEAALRLEANCEHRYERLPEFARW